MLQEETKKLEEQLVTSATNTLSMLEEAEKQKQEGLVLKFDDLVERSKGFKTEKLSKIDEVQGEMAKIE